MVVAEEKNYLQGLDEGLKFFVLSPLMGVVVVGVLIFHQVPNELALEVEVLCLVIQKAVEEDLLYHNYFYLKHCF